MPKSKSIRIIIDTNLWISYILSKKLDQLDEFISSNRFQLLFSIELLEEIEATIKKPKLQKYFDETSLEEMFIAFEPFIDLVSVKSNVKVCRDSKDDFLLALAKDGKADYLLTGDKDLLEIKKNGKTIILMISEFLKNYSHHDKKKPK
jgi:putative PIN family toxin of toxin-antitoxin system